jgi:hypothetical protein
VSRPALVTLADVLARKQAAARRRRTEHERAVARMALACRACPLIPVPRTP